MHVLSGYAQFYPNLYEYLSDGTGIDSLRTYFKHYEYSYLDKSKSVVGPVVNGKQTYIDSVMVTYNSLANTLHADLDVEDSSYTFLMPNNAAWIQAYNQIKPYYKYAATTNSQVITDGSSVISTRNVTANAAYMQDSLTKKSIVTNLIFSNNGYSKWVEDSKAVSTDTIYTTSRNKLSNPQTILARTVDKVTMSNGYARVIDSLAYLPWETYAPELNLSPLNRNNFARALYASKHAVRVDHPNTAMGDFSLSGLSFMWLEATGPYVKPELDVYLPNVLSTTYNIYCVIVPANADLTDTSTVVKPNQLKFELNYAKSDGTLSTKIFGLGTASDPYRVNDTSKVDTMLVGTYTFPVAYRGLGDYYPNIKITSPFSAFSAVAKKYTRDLRIAAIILRPVEMDAYVKKEN
jgi:hypothetical protein